MKSTWITFFSIAHLLAAPGIGRADRDDRGGVRKEAGARAGTRAHGYDDPDEDLAEPRPQFGFGSLFGVESFDVSRQNLPGLPGLDPSADDAWGADARVGCRSHPVLAAEIQGGTMASTTSRRAPRRARRRWAASTWPAAPPT